MLICLKPGVTCKERESSNNYLSFKWNQGDDVHVTTCICLKMLPEGGFSLSNLLTFLRSWGNVSSVSFGAKSATSSFWGLEDLPLSSFPFAEGPGTNHILWWTKLNWIKLYSSINVAKPQRFFVSIQTNMTMLLFGLVLKYHLDCLHGKWKVTRKIIINFGKVKYELYWYLLFCVIAMPQSFSLKQG